VSINGANRLGSNSLPELLVFGARAGRSAAALARRLPAPSGAAVATQVADEERRLRSLFGGGRERISTLRRELQAAMEKGAGICRSEAGLRATTAKIAELRERYRDVHLDDSSRTFNTEWIAAIELGHLLDAAEACAHSALSRRESRGSHLRTDFPRRDDSDFLAHSLARRREGAEPRIEYLPVTITRWPPGERIHGPTAGGETAARDEEKP
jgi:fumarate reductase flavoprotein subunit